MNPYLKSAKAELEQIEAQITNDKIDYMKAKLQKKSAATQIKFQDSLKSIKSKLSQLKDRLKHESNEGKEAIRESISDLQRSLKSLKKHIT